MYFPNSGCIWRVNTVLYSAETQAPSSSCLWLLYMSLCPLPALDSMLICSTAYCRLILNLIFLAIYIDLLGNEKEDNISNIFPSSHRSGSPTEKGPRRWSGIKHVAKGHFSGADACWKRNMTTNRSSDGLRATLTAWNIVMFWVFKRKCIFSSESLANAPFDCSHSIGPYSTL